MLRSARVLLAVAATGSAAACGSSQASDLSVTAAHVLEGDVAAVTVAATARDPAHLATAMTRLRADVLAQQRSGGLTPARAARILAAGARVAQDVGSPPLPEVTHAPTSTPHGTHGGQGDGHGEGDRGGGGGD